MLRFACTAFLAIESEFTHRLPVKNVKLYVQMYQIRHQFHTPLGGILQKLLLQCEWASLQACYTTVVPKPSFTISLEFLFSFLDPIPFSSLVYPPQFDGEHLPVSSREHILRILSF